MGIMHGLLTVRYSNAAVYYSSNETASNETLNAQKIVQQLINFNLKEKEDKVSDIRCLLSKRMCVVGWLQFRKFTP